MTITELSYRYASQKRRGNDYEFVQLVRSSIITNRSLLIRREAEKTKSYPLYSIRKVSCIALESVPAAECCEIDIDCNLYRTAILPSMIHVSSLIPVINVAGILFNDQNKVVFNYVEPFRMGFLSGKFNFNKFFTIINNRLILPIERRIQFIDIQLIPEDLDKLVEFVDCNKAAGLECTVDNVEIEGHLVPIIEDLLDKQMGFKSNSEEVEVNAPNK